MFLPPSITISDPLKLPVRVIQVDGYPKIIAGGVPVTPINIVLKRRRERKGATPDSLDTYARASRLYCEFCGHLGRSIIDVSDAEFYSFENALLCELFRNMNGEWVSMKGKKKRSARTADLMLSLIYSVAADIEELYDVNFDWRRYERLPRELLEIVQAIRGYGRINSFPRVHRSRYSPRKIVGLPDDQFEKLIEGARDLWYDSIADGDIAFAGEPEAQRGALFYRNMTILLVLRYAGSRRREVTFIRLCDIRRSESKLYLVTKRHGGEYGKRLPVILFPFVDEAIWKYVTKFRPCVKGGLSEDQQRVFLSHSVRNYGRSVTPQTVRKIIEKLRPFLDSPWNEIVSPHMLRHSFGYQMQKFAGPSACMASMRHASPESGKDYSAGIENFIDDLAEEINAEIEDLLSRTHLLELLAEGGVR